MKWNEQTDRQTDRQSVGHSCFACPLFRPLAGGFRHWLEFMTWTYVQVSQLHERHLPVVCVASEHPAHCKAVVIRACPNLAFVVRVIDWLTWSGFRRLLGGMSSLTAQAAERVFLFSHAAFSHSCMLRDTTQEVKWIRIRIILCLCHVFTEIAGTRKLLEAAGQHLRSFMDDLFLRCPACFSAEQWSRCYRDRSTKKNLKLWCHLSLNKSVFQCVSAMIFAHLSLQPSLRVCLRFCQPIIHVPRIPLMSDKLAGKERCESVCMMLYVKKVNAIMFI